MADFQPMFQSLLATSSVRNYYLAETRTSAVEVAVSMADSPGSDFRKLDAGVGEVVACYSSAADRTSSLMAFV